MNIESYRASEVFRSRQIPPYRQTSAEEGIVPSEFPGDSFAGSTQQWQPYNPTMLKATFVQTERPYKAPNPKETFVNADESERTPEVVRAQQSAVDGALAGDGRVTFSNSEGRSFDMQLRKTKLGYEYRAGKDRLNIRFDPKFTEQQRREALAKLIDYHSQEPEHLRRAVQHINVEPGDRAVKVKKDQSLTTLLQAQGFKKMTPSLLEAMKEVNGWKEVPTTFKAGDTVQVPVKNYGAYFAGDDARGVTFVGIKNIEESTFRHEFGHGVGYLATADFLPRDWHRLAAKDPETVSKYGSRKDKQTGVPEMSDDFAEFYLAYMEARETGPKAMADLKRRFPNRSQVIEQIVAGNHPQLQRYKNL